MREIIVNLKYLGFHNVANQLHDFNQKFFPNGVPKGPDSREKVFNKFTDEDEFSDYIDDMDNKFWKVCDELEDSLNKHIAKMGIDINLNNYDKHNKKSFWQKLKSIFEL